jgi:hypothetical protein
VDLIVIILLAAIIVALLHVLVRFRKDDYTALANRMAKKSRGSLEVMRPCPLCASLLRRGERVHTVVFSKPAPGSDGHAEKPRIKESMVHMFGCRYCRPPDGTMSRICPVCKRTIGEEGYAIARMFERDRRKHIHVLGCTECRHGR